MEIKIRPLEENDAYTSVKWRNIPDLWTHTTFKATREITIEDELNWIKKVTNNPNDARFAITADGKYVGNIYLTNIEDGVGEYHIFIGEKEYWGKGIARQASVQLIEYAKKRGLEAIYLEVKQDNAGAYHLYEKLGFKRLELLESGFTAMKLELGTWLN